jgi:FkbM family methyltransferase
VGANNGQTIKKMKQFYPNCDLHSFEPSKICFAFLTKNFNDIQSLKLNNVAIGDRKTSLSFNEYSWSSLNSLLKRASTNRMSLISRCITIDDCAGKM